MAFPQLVDLVRDPTGLLSHRPSGFVHTDRNHRRDASSQIHLDGLRPLERCNRRPVILVTGVGHQDERATA
jgi:hypothetical protein